MLPRDRGQERPVWNSNEAGTVFDVVMTANVSDKLFGGHHRGSIVNGRKPDSKKQVTESLPC